MTDNAREQLKILRELSGNKMLLTVPEVANILGVKADTLKADATLPLFRFQGKNHVYVNIVNLAQWLTERKL